jgi:DNA polymerase III subunit epsilon
MKWISGPGRSARVDLDLGWREATYCAVDVETTGLDLRRDSIVSIGLVCIRQGRIVGSESYYSLIRPASPVSVASMQVHCLRPADLEDAPDTRDVGREIARQLSGRIVIAHAAWIERAFLGRLLRQAGARFVSPVIDTAALARALGYAGDVPRGHEPSLELLARRLSLPVYSPHNALGDALTTAAVFLAMATRAGRPGGQGSARSLIALSASGKRGLRQVLERLTPGQRAQLMRAGERAHPGRVGLRVVAQGPPDRLAQEEVALAQAGLDRQGEQA